MPELQCCSVRISVWIHLRAFTSINGLIINKFPLSSLGVRLFYKYDELLYWTENILENLSSETDAKPNSNLPPPTPNKQKKEAALCDRLAVTSCLWLWIQKQNQGLQTSHDSISLRAHCVWLSVQCAYAARVPQYWEAAAADTAVTNDCWWRNKVNQLSSLVLFA